LILGRRCAPLAALVLCVLTELVVAYAYAALRGDPGSAGYAALVVGLTLGMALATGLAAAALSASVEATLVAWVAIETLARFGTSLGFGLPLGLGLAAATAFALRIASGKQASAYVEAVTVGIALCAGFILTKPVFDALPPHAAVGPLPAWARVSVGFVATLLPLALLLRAGWRIARVPLAPVVGSAGLVLILAAVAGSSPDPDTSGFAKTRAHGREVGPNLLLLVLDTVRADHMSLYGYALPTTPELEGHLRLGNHTPSQPRTGPFPPTSLSSPV